MGTVEISNNSIDGAKTDHTSISFPHCAAIGVVG